MEFFTWEMTPYHKTTFLIIVGSLNIYNKLSRFFFVKITTYIYALTLSYLMLDIYSTTSKEN